MTRTWFGRGALFVFAVGLMLWLMSFGFDVLSFGDTIPAQDAPPAIAQRDARKSAQIATQSAQMHTLARNVLFIGLVLTVVAWANAKRRAR